MANAALKTSTFTHPFTITVTSWSVKTFNNGTPNVPLLRDQDTVTCSQHGSQTIVGTATIAKDLDGRKFARVGDLTTCGATIATGDPAIGLS